MRCVTGTLTGVRPSIGDVPDGRGVLVRTIRVGLCGTDREIIDACFCGVPSRIQGAGFAELESDQRLRMNRRFQLVRPADGATLLRAQTTFVCIELSSGKPKRMPAEFIDGYGQALLAGA